MNPRTTGILALVALLLGAFVYLYEIEGDVAREAEREDEKRIFPGLEAGDVDALELTTTDGVAARFERREGAWRIVVPTEGRGDATALDAIASALVQLARAGTVKAAPGDRAQFGLGDGARVVRFGAKDATRTLRIGRGTPVGGNLYVAAGEDGEVAFVERYRLNALDRALGDLRDRRILPHSADAPARLRLSWPEAKGTAGVTLERAGEADDGDWWIREPIAARADQQTVRALVSDLEYLQAAGFVEERTPAVEAALAETALSIEWESGTLRIAGLLEGARVAVGPDGALYTLAPERLDGFPRDLGAYRDKQLVELEADGLAKIELALPGGDPIALERGETGWSAGARAIDADLVAELAVELAALRAASVVADEMGPAELASVGLAPPAARIRIEGATTVELELGRLDPERGLFARRAGEPTVYALPASSAETLPLDSAAFDARYGPHAAEAMTPVPDADPSATAAPATDLLEQ